MSTKTTALKLIKPDVNDKKGQTIDDLASNFEKIDKAVSWVGMIIQSTVIIVPENIYGGTWRQLSGRVLVGAGTDFPAGTQGGEKSHVLTVTEMPAHAHYTMAGYGDLDQSKPEAVQLSHYKNGANNANIIKSTGAGSAHNNMPPYKAIYMWERTD